MTFRYLFFSLAIAFNGKAQNRNTDSATPIENSIVADSLKRIAQELNNDGKYLESLAIYNELHQLFTNENKLREAVKNLENIAKLNLNFSHTEKSDSILNEAFTVLATNEVDSSNHLLYKLYYRQGTVDIMLGKVDSSLANAQKAIDVIKKNKIVDNKVEESIYSNKAAAHYYLENLDSTIYYFKKSLSKGIARLKTNGSDSISSNLFPRYANLGAVYTKMHNYRKAFEYYNIALEIVKLFGANSPNQEAILYLNVGLNLSNQGAFNEGLAHINKSLEILNENGILFNHSNKHSLLIASEGYLKAGLFKEADSLLTVFRSATNVETQVNDIIKWSYNVAYLHFHKKDYQSAIPYLEQVIELNEDNNSDSFLSFTYLNLLLCRLNLGQLDKLPSLIALTENLLYEGNYTHHSALFTTKLAKADYYLQLDSIDLAVSILDSAINKNQIFSTNNSPLGYFEPQDQVNLLRKLSECYKASNPSKAIEIYHQIDELVDKIRFSYHSFEDRITLSDSVNHAYDDAVSLLIQSINGENIVSDQKLASELFFFLERSKSFNLLAEVQQRGLTKESSFNKLINQINETQSNIDYYLGELSSAIQQVDTNKIEFLKSKISTLSNQKDKLKSTFKSNSETQYNMLYGHQVSKLEHIQAQLENDELSIAFRWTRNDIYAVSISNEEIKIFSLGSVKEINSKIDQFLSNLNLNAAKTSDVSNFKDSAFELYESLLEPILKDASFSKLIIIPDEKINLIPFETLVMDTSGENFNQLSYLIKDYEIRYSQSFTLLKEFNNRKILNDRVLAIAPEFRAKDFTLAEITGQERSNLGYIPYSKKEVLSINEILGADLLVGSEATEAALKSNIEDYGIIHLATHGVINHENPLKSKLILEKSVNDSLSDGLLHLHEILNLDLEAEMIVLSSCNSGIGRLKKGEGLTSLSTGFFYAGANSIIMSLWPANDLSTARIMSNFYQNLDKRLTKSASIRKAKLDYLSNSPLSIAHPYYWSQFVLYGKNDPVKVNNRIIWIITIVSLCFIAITLFLKRKFIRLNKS